MNVTQKSSREADGRELLTRLSSAWMFSWQIKTLRPVKFTARTNFRPPAPVWGINTRQWSRLGPGSISDDTIISYFLTRGLSSAPRRGRMSCGRLNENKRENKGLGRRNDIYVQKCNKSNWESSLWRVCSRVFGHGFRRSALLRPAWLVTVLKWQEAFKWRISHFNKTKRQKKQEEIGFICTS